MPYILRGRLQLSLLAFVACFVPATVACTRDQSSGNVESQGPQTTAAAAATTGVQERQGRTLVDAKSLSLDELVRRADRILRGTVRRIEEKNVTLTEGGESVDARIREVTVRVDEGIKNIATGEDVVIRQLVSVSAPLRENEEVLWYLPKSSTLGLSQPLGVYSGDFRIDRSGSVVIVNNLRGNAGLWEGSLWSGDGFSRSRVLDTAAKEMALPPARVSTIDRAAILQPDNRDIPLDLLLAATKSRVAR